jgi:hypothetical protein
MCKWGKPYGLQNLGKSNGELKLDPGQIMQCACHGALVVPLLFHDGAIGHF